MKPFACSDYRRLLSDALDGPLPAAERAAFDAHGAACAPCFAHMKDAVVVRETLHGLAVLEEKESEKAPALSEALVQRILSARTLAVQSESRDARKKA